MSQGCSLALNCGEGEGLALRLKNSIAFGKALQRETREEPGLHGPSGHYVGPHAS